MSDKSISHEISVLIKAAKAGVGAAAHELGGRYREGNGIPPDIVLALHWYEVGAKLRHAGAQNDLGSMHLNGLGCSVDAKVATHWYRLVPLPQATLRVLRRFWQTHRHPELLFPNRHAGLKGAHLATSPLDRGGVQITLRKVATECGLKKRSLRTACATATPRT